MQGEHKPGYRAPRTGEKRATRQPLKIDKLEQPVRDAILKARAEGKTWEETAELASKATSLDGAVASSLDGKGLAVSVVHRWYDIRVEQVQREVMAQAAKAREWAAVLAEKEFSGLPEAAVNAFSAAAFEMMEAGSPADRLKAALGLVRVSAMVHEGEIQRERLELDKKRFTEVDLAKLELDKKKLEAMAAKVQGLKSDVQKKKLSSEELARKLDEIYDIGREAA